MIYDNSIVDFDTVSGFHTGQALHMVQNYNSYIETGHLWYLASLIADYMQLTVHGVDIKLPAHVLAAAAIEGFLL